MKTQYDIIGYIGVFFISTNLLPQIYHVYTIQNADSISNLSIVLGILSGMVMSTYGFLIEKTPIIISNLCILVFYTVLFSMKQYYFYCKTKIQISNTVTLENQIHDNWIMV